MNTKYKKIAFATLTITFLMIVSGVFFNLLGNVTVNYYSGISTDKNIGIPLGVACETNVIETGKEVTFVFTEPFTNLSSYDKAKIIKKIKTTEGTVKTFLTPGKYGLYMETSGTGKQLYGDLKIDNARRDIPINSQGPWFIKVDYLGNVYSFNKSLAC